MKIIRPITITPTLLDSSNVTASSLTAWSSGSTYTSGDQVLADNADGIPHEYTWFPPTEDNVSANSDYPPSTHSVTKRSDMNPDANSVDDDYRCYWLDLGPSNRWAMFSNRCRRATTRTDGMEVEFSPGELFNALVLVNVEADSVEVTVDDPVDGEVYNATADMMDLSNVYDFYTWCFAPLIRNDVITLLDLPAYIDATVTVTVTDTGNTAQVGELIVGQIVDVGPMSYGATIDGTDYSTNDIDDQGNATLKQRTYTKGIDYPVKINTADINYVQRVLDDLRATPSVFIGVDDRPETVIYGVCTDFSEVMSGPVKSDCSIQVRELSL